MTIEQRKKLERRIARRLILDAIKAGYTLGVHDGDEVTLEHSSKPGQILKALATTDEDFLLVFQGEKRIGWVRFVYGNDGWDVINDYTTNLEPIMAGVNAIEEKYS